MSIVDPTPAAPDQAEGPRESNAHIVLQFQVQTGRVRGQRSDGTVYLRETYQLVANVGLGRKKANRIAALLNQLRVPVARRELVAAPSSSSSGAPEPPKTHAVQCIEEGRPQDWWLLKAHRVAQAPCAGTTDAVSEALAMIRAENGWAHEILSAELSRLRSSLAERQGAEPPTGSKTREIL